MKISVFLAFACVVILASPLYAETFTVNSADDVADGTCDNSHCSLREAIIAANANAGKDSIEFAINGSGPHTIMPQSELPEVTDPAVVNAYTQSGASPNTNPIGSGSNATLMIEIDGSSAGTNASGLRINAGDSEVRGLAINRFDWMGISIASSKENIIAGNFIGLDVSGTQAPGNGFAGVHISDADNNRVGGTLPEARNVISGNADSGVWIQDGDGNQVQGSYIGTDLTGTTDFGNSEDGIIIQDASNNLIGGTSLAARNVISENSRNGIYICCSGGLHSGNQLRGNLIGTDASGVNPLANGDDGVLILGGQGHVVGGDTSGAGNVVSANEGDGISLALEARQITVQGNLIGVDSNGTGVLGNEGNGIRIRPSSRDALGHQIGGTTSQAQNVISGNLRAGISVSNAETVSIEGNYIGTGSNGSTNLGNGGDGIELRDSRSNRIGGQSSGAGNAIAFNQGDGISIVGLNIDPVHNAIRKNRIYENSELGIDLGDDGVTANDIRDSDTGPNGFQNYPQLISVRTNDANEVIISGVLESLPNRQFTLEFFTIQTCDPSGHGEGRRLLGSTTRTTNDQGTVSFSVNMAGEVSTGAFLTSTATNKDGNTSEFSDCLRISSLDTSASFLIERQTGNVFADGSFNASGADLAEYIAVSDPVEPGDLVAIDPNNPAHYRKTQQAHSELATGVIATDPGVVLGVGSGTNSSSSLLDLGLATWISPTNTVTSSVNFTLTGLVPRLDFDVTQRPVLALMGQVEVKATTANGPIEPGDLLVSASKPGYVMRCADPDACEGAIVGKALEALTEGRGTIRMLVIR